MIQQLVEQIRARFAELEALMSDPAVIADRERYAEVGREYRQLKAARDLAEEYLTLKDDLEGARELLAEGEDEEMRAVVDEAPARLEALEEEIRLAMVERDPNDEKNVIVENRAGTGGGRLQGGHLRSARRGRLLGLQVRGRHASRPAGAGDREPGPHPHLDRDH